MKLLRVNIQDGENSYSEYLKVKDEKEAKEITSNYFDGFERAVKNSEIMDISEYHLKVLEKFGII